jgi:hypothetical protein
VRKQIEFHSYFPPPQPQDTENYGKSSLILLVLRILPIQSDHFVLSYISDVLSDILSKKGHGKFLNIETTLATIAIWEKGNHGMRTVHVAAHL